MIPLLIGVCFGGISLEETIADWESKLKRTTISEIFPLEGRISDLLMFGHFRLQNHVREYMMVKGLRHIYDSLSSTSDAVSDAYTEILYCRKLVGDFKPQLDEKQFEQVFADFEEAAALFETHMEAFQKARLGIRNSWVVDGLKGIFQAAGEALEVHNFTVKILKMELSDLRTRLSFKRTCDIEDVQLLVEMEKNTKAVVFMLWRFKSQAAASWRDMEFSDLDFMLDEYEDSLIDVGREDCKEVLQSKVESLADLVRYARMVREFRSDLQIQWVIGETLKTTAFLARGAAPDLLGQLVQEYTAAQLSMRDFESKGYVLREEDEIDAWVLDILRVLFLHMKANVARAKENVKNRLGHLLDRTGSY